MNKFISPLLVFIVTLLAVSCGNGGRKSLTILKITEHGSARVSDSAIISLLESQTDISVKMLYDLEEEVALRKLADKTIDMAIIPSNTLIKKDEFSVSTVMPLLPRLLMVLTKPGTQACNLKELLENNLVFYEDMSAMDSLFFRDIFQSFNINPAKVKGELISDRSVNHLSGTSSVYIGLTHVHNPFVTKLLESGWTLFSLDKVSQYGHGSAVEGFQM